MSADNPSTELSPAVYWQGRVWSSPRASEPKIQPLSILDATVARFSPCGAIWLFDRTPAHDAREAQLFERLKTSLSCVLALYPHWTGHLRWAEQDEVPAPQRHAGRIVVEYGTATDPGVDLVFARNTAHLEDLVPTQSARRTESPVWDSTAFPQADVVNQTDLALHDLLEWRGLPGLSVQLTAFACGGYSVALQLSHPLADAQALSVFVRHWAGETQKLFNSDKYVRIMELPVFDPNLLQAHALPISGGAPEPKKVEVSRALPKHRFSWWETEAKGYPSWALTTTSNNASLLPAADVSLSPATPAPWPTWDPSLSVKHILIRFTSAQTLALRNVARSSPASPQTISRLDAVLAHMWLLINKARAPLHPQPESGEDLDPTMYLDLTLGVRTRVDPPLPETFIGSPILIMNVSAPLSSIIDGSTTLPKAASLIRTDMSLFTPEAVSAHLHDTAHEEVPQRLWGTFMGSRHVLVTSWTRLSAYKVDFWGDGQMPRFVRGIMPPCDGLVQVMDTDVEGEMDISLHLEARAMENLLARGVYDF